MKKRVWKNDLVINVVEHVEENTDIDKVVDVIVLPYHNFITNGIVSHNCNFSSNIIDPIQSRCAIFRFRAHSEEAMKKFIKRIAEKEGLNVDESGVKALVDIAEGDLRRLANLLQAAAAISKDINEDLVYEVASLAKPKDVKEMLELALSGKFKEARQKLYDMLIKQGLAGDDIIKQIHKEIYKLNIPDEKKVQLVEKVGEYEFRISEGGDPLIQIEALLAQVMLIGKSK